MLGLGLSVPSLAFTGFMPLSAQIAAMFRNSEQGAVYDPSDWPTLYQDAAGTSPVTAVGQPVGLMLDKRLGLVRGPELVVNGDNESALFSGPLGAVSGINATVSRAAAPGGGFALAVSPTGGTVAHHAILYLAANKAYEISARVYVPTGSIAVARLFDAVDGSWLGPTSTLKDQWVTLRGIRPAGKAASWAVGVGENSNSANIDGQVFYIDDLSVKELPGNHATQPTAINRPVLSARVNLLTKTDALSNAAWVRVGGPVVTDNAALAPDGTMTAASLVPTSASASVYQTLNAPADNTMCVEAKANGKNFLYIIDGTGGSVGASFNLLTGVVDYVFAGYTATISARADGYFLCTLKRLTGAYTYFQIGVSDASGSIVTSADGGKGILIWHPQFERGPTATRYQRVNTATDYDTVGFPVYLAWNGTNSWMQTAAIDFTGTDKVMVVAGVRKLSDAAAGVIAELSASAAVANGAFALFAPGGASASTYALSARGTLLGYQVNATPFAAPTTNVATGLVDIAAMSRTLRVSGLAFSAVSDMGAGNFGNHPLHLGARAGSSLFFNGNLYGLVIRGALSSDPQIASAERFMAGKTGVTI